MTILGYEATLVVSGSDHPDEPSAMPTLVIGMAVRSTGRALRSARTPSGP